MPADPLTLGGIALAILFAGSIKGAIGIGFPAVAMSMLPLMIPPALAITILALPIVVTNVQQVFTTPGWPAVIRRFLPAGLTIVVVTFFVSRSLELASASVMEVVVGVSLILFSGAALFNIRIPVNDGVAWQVAAGAVSGIIGGLSAVKSPAIIYTAALELPRDTFVAAVGFLFLCGGVGLLTGLATTALLDTQTFLASVGATAVALAGFALGSEVRKRLPLAAFRSVLLWMMMLLGVRAIAVNLI
ncbi:sulfite exporter TauE/SafE family protein [Histidinibacterium lentulum]|uniref:Probable membrane transporter protein n=1 Tax=Histidinibacterium lentulum TaxID=2480588 RepID=A0A3N2RA12_9RHOB|nr:sulfite exporter TauE/SafE family protein [Histidinibacterium lentulum]ROU04247.1 sulfite exporter TauE/SafE family protein [Histidinibacterium lentulum]